MIHKIQDLASECAKWEAITKSEVPIFFALDDLVATTRYLDYGKGDPLNYVLMAFTRVQELEQRFSRKADYSLEDLRARFVLLGKEVGLSIDPLNHLTFKMYQVRDSLFALLVEAVIQHNLRVVQNEIGKGELRA